MPLKHINPLVSLQDLDIHFPIVTEGLALITAHSFC